eukprot:gb/GFBE01069720.1/.p1 GENE.gb/GFBE01069720.1/~~gb/GFBE01069720.1/.p1  ORF type:complete len:304 (+),score=24.72 gb/GFBE01069720.1/:1-912(+)
MGVSPSVSSTAQDVEAAQRVPMMQESSLSREMAASPTLKGGAWEEAYPTYIDVNGQPRAAGDFEATPTYVNANGQLMSVLPQEPAGDGGKTKLWHVVVGGACSVCLCASTVLVILSYSGIYLFGGQPASSSQQVAEFSCQDDSTSDWSSSKRDWCCQNHQVGCPQADIQTITPAVIFDCDEGFEQWERNWSEQKSHWCCSNEQKGCDAPATSTDAPPHVPASTAAPAAPTTDPRGCDTPCTEAGKTFSCKDRIQFAATHAYANKEGACKSAYSQVQVECSVCAACLSPEAAACTPLPVTGPAA